MINLRVPALTLALMFVGASAAQAAPKDDGGGAVRLILVGPGIVLLLLIALALVALIAAFLRRADTLAAFMGRVLRCLEERRVITPLWGIAAAAFCLVTAFALFGTKILALLGVLMLLTGFCLTGIGLCIASVHLGKLWTEALGRQDSELTALGLGLMILLLAAGVPFVGWLAVVIAIGGGVGAVLECLFGRR